MDGTKQSVVCVACKWEGDRRYVSSEDPIGRREGFGLCPVCRTPLTRRPKRYVPGGSKLASLPANGLR